LFLKNPLKMNSSSSKKTFEKVLQVLPLILSDDPSSAMKDLHTQ